jgi:radical SAM superfamily enzyme YgiQ (UPF0313 family)
VHTETAAHDPAKPDAALPYERVVVVLIKPTHYDDDGFPYRFWRGVLPSNSLAAMHTLTMRALDELLPSGMEREVHLLEDGIGRHARRLERLLARFPEPGTKLVVGLVAVQTAQFPRACDLIERWQRAGATCLIGGFHVSGSVTTLLDGIRDATRKDVPHLGIMPPEVQALLDRGVVVFVGEAEESWPRVLDDVLRDRATAMYRGGRPDLGGAPLPRYPEGYFDGSFVTEMGTFDTGRGCIFACSFCSIINVQGRTMRHRDPAAIVAMVRETCERRGRAQFFFTDDNFARNPRYEELLDGLIELRRNGHPISFMIEADLASYKIPRFLEKLAEAGCTQIFMGVESMNPANLHDARKNQNKVDQYRQLWQKCHDLGILVHAGYIVGFPHDTPESVRRDVEDLFEHGADQASFFILSPCPGSEDHVRAVAAGIPMDADLSRYDTFHPVVDHPRMSRDEWLETYLHAWRQFYRVSNMVAAMRRCRDREARFNLLRNYIWYRWSFATERTHPMIAGFYRFRPWRERRPGAAPMSRPRFLAQEGVRHLRYGLRLMAEFYRFQQVVFEAEFAPLLAEKRDEIGVHLQSLRGWLRLTFGRAASREWLNTFWTEYGRRHWHRLLHPRAYRWHARVPLYALTELVYTFRFVALIPRIVRTS